MWTAQGLIIHPTFGMLAGAEKSLKSYLAQILAVGVTAGVPVLGHFAVPRAVPVVMYCGEGGERPYTRRLQRICDAYGVRFTDLDLFTTFDTGSVLSTAFQDSYQQMLRDHRPALTVTIARPVAVRPFSASPEQDQQNGATPGGPLKKRREPQTSQLATSSWRLRWVVGSGEPPSTTS